MRDTITRRVTFSIGLAAATCGFLLLAGAPLTAQEETGTPAEAKRMLDRAVAAMKADKAKALASFSNLDRGFAHRDSNVSASG